MSPPAQLELEIGFEGGVRAELATILAGYRPEPGLYDELMDEKGRVRPHWDRTLAYLAQLGSADIRRAFDVADRHMRDSGVVHRVYDDPGGADRPWPLAHVPLVLTDADWRSLAAGITQRARLHEALLSDLYGPAEMVRKRIVPAAVVAGNGEFLRPLCGVTPTGGHFLHIYAADVSRGPDGRWWVLSDRTQAPSGLGYAIENRIALSRSLPDLFRGLHVDRLSAFYQRFRSALAAMTARSDPRIALLTPGPHNEIYFEHAYMARCLGFLLVEGGDLAVHDNVVYVRTIEGPKRIDVIVRRIDADFADPLELNSASRLGIPGLIEAIRSGTVILANALGSGLTEAPALNGYLPALSKRLLDEDLLLPSLATWWCGDPAARAEVLKTFDTKAILPAFGRSLKGQLENSGVLGAAVSPAEKARLIKLIERRGMDFVGQEPVRLATTPVWERGRLVPRPYAMRVFAARGPNGWTVMPGGLCRISDRLDARSLSMQRGGRSADVWVTGEKPPEQSTLIARAEDVEVSRETNPLPSRAADNLFWLGRYLERADATLRLIRCLSGLGSDSGPSDDEEAPAERLLAILSSWGAIPFALGDPRMAAIVALESDLAGAMPALLENAYRTAQAIRDRMSPDAWRALTDLHGRFHVQVPAVLNAEIDRNDADATEETMTQSEEALRAIAALAGLAHENMNRLGGWRFLDLGMRVERAISVARFARRLAEDPTASAVSASSLDRLLDLIDAQIAYRGRYLSGPARRPVLDLVLLDVSHPRSVAFQVEQIVVHLGRLAARAPENLIDPAEGLARQLWERLQRETAQSFDVPAILGLEADLMAISDAITQRYLAGPPTAEDRDDPGQLQTPSMISADMNRFEWPSDATPALAVAPKAPDISGAMSGD